MGWKHIPDNEEAWLYYKADLLYFGSPQDMRRYISPPEGWEYGEWMNTRFDSTGALPNYIYLEE